MKELNELYETKKGGTDRYPIYLRALKVMLINNYQQIDNGDDGPVTGYADNMYRWISPDSQVEIDVWIDEKDHLITITLMYRVDGLMSGDVYSTLDYKMTMDANRDNLNINMLVRTMLNTYLLRG